MLYDEDTPPKPGSPTRPRMRPAWQPQPGRGYSVNTTLPNTSPAIIAANPSAA